VSEIDEELAASIRARVGHAVCGGKYFIESVLGVGGMSAVYGAVHRNGRRVAVKLLHPEHSRRGDLKKRFLRECQTANAVDHPGVVAIIDDDITEDGAAVIVMERLEGKTLESLWQSLGQRLPARAVLAIGRELCSVLAVAHRAGIVHRDLKPENLFLTSDGHLKVLDFGLASLRDDTRPKDTHTGMVFGTPAFMPPEQASGQVSLIDARSDIWAAGATLFTLLSGELVHPGETAQHMMMLSATNEARSLDAALPHAHPVLVEIVDRALTREKERRWQSAEAMREAIIVASETLIGEAEVPLPTPVALLEMAQARTRRMAPLAGAIESEEPTTHRQKLNPIEEDERTDVERTRVGVHPDVSTEAPDTQKTRAPGMDSVTPTDQTKTDEIPTQIRPSWSDLEGAIKQSARALPAGKPAPAGPEQRFDQTAILHPDVRPAAAQWPVSSGNLRVNTPSFAHPVPELPKASARADTRRTVVTRKPKSRISPYVPIVAAAVLLGLTPLAFFLVRNCGAPPAEIAAPVVTDAGTGVD
jgi:serine/threonine protein kinase